MMLEEYFCTKCQVSIYYDDTEKEWGCDCTAAFIVLDDEDGLSVEWIPDYWINTEANDDLPEM